MLAPFCFSHLIALFTEQLPMDNNMHTHSDMHAGQQADTSQIGHEQYTELSAKHVGRSAAGEAFQVHSGPPVPLRIPSKSEISLS